jgi:hypothetical protein
MMTMVVAVMTPAPMIADAPRTMIRRDDPAARRQIIGGIVVVIGVIVIVGIVVPNPSNQNAPEMVTMGERMAAMPAAASRRGVECAVTTAERAVAAESAMPTMPAANFDLQVVGNDTLLTEYGLSRDAASARRPATTGSDKNTARASPSNRSDPGTQPRKTPRRTCKSVMCESPTIPNVHGDI